MYAGAGRTEPTALQAFSARRVCPSPTRRGRERGDTQQRLIQCPPLPPAAPASSTTLSRRKLAHIPIAYSAMYVPVRRRRRGERAATSHFAQGAKDPFAPSINGSFPFDFQGQPLARIDPHTCRTPAKRGARLGAAWDGQHKKEGSGGGDRRMTAA